MLRILILLAATAPAVAATVSVVGLHWAPGGDQALEVLRISDVGGPHTPLLGAWSRWGWSHPGPMLFWLLAPWQRALGNDGVLLACGLISVGSLACATLIGFRRGGTALGALLGFAGVVLTRAMGLSVLVDVWNPYVAILPFLVFVLLVWSVTCDDLVMAPFAAAVGTFCVQAHVGFLPLVGGLAGLAAAAVGVRHLRGRARGVRRSSPSARSRDRPGSSPQPRPAHLPRPDRTFRGWLSAHRATSSALATVGVLVLLWLPALIDELWGSRNLTSLWRYMRAPGTPTAGWGSAVGIMSAQLHLPAPWMGAPATNDAGLSPMGGWTWAAAAAILLTLAAGWAMHRRRQEAVLLDLVALGAIGLGAWATSRVTGPLFAYTMQWWWIISMLAAVALVWTAIDTFGVGRAMWVPVALLAATVVASAAAVVEDLPVERPQPLVSQALSQLIGPTAAALDPGGTYSVHAVDQRNLGSIGPGMLLALIQRGLHATAAPGDGASIQFGAPRVRPPAETTGVLDVVSLEALDDGWEPPPGTRELTRYDPLTPAERDEMRGLQSRIRSSLGASAPPGILQMNTRADVERARRHDVSERDITRFRYLQSKGSGFAVLLSPPPAG